MSQINVLKMNGNLLPMTANGQSLAFYEAGGQMDPAAVASVYAATAVDAHLLARDEQIAELRSALSALEAKLDAFVAKADTTRSR